VKVDRAEPTGELSEVAVRARSAEVAGYNGVSWSEVAHDPLLAAALGAAATDEIEVSTAIAVAFARTPMTVAYAARDISVLSRGRFVLGLGSQIQTHVERRFSMPWSHPVARMREFVAALHAIWDAWDEGTRLRFRGELYRHTVMPPLFDPGPNPFGRPKVRIAGVGPAMTRAAGAVGDGLLVHSFTTARFLSERTMPALDEGLAERSAARSAIEVCLPALIVTGRDERSMAEAARQVRSTIAFYASTPAYRPVLELHGWEELGDELHRRSLRARGDADAWAAMGELVDDEVLGTVAIVAEPGAMVGEILGRYGGLVDRFSFAAPYDLDDELAEELVRGVQEASGDAPPG
jgi:probable F420-dependent oxidoreductase